MTKLKLFPLVQYEKSWFKEILECLDEKIKFITFEYLDDIYAYCCFDFDDKSCEPVFVDGNPIIFLNLLDRLLDKDHHIVKAGKKALAKLNVKDANQGLYFSRVAIEVPGHLAAKFGVFSGILDNSYAEYEDLSGEDDED
jgi:hypothetical protein